MLGFLKTNSGIYNFSYSLKVLEEISGPRNPSTPPPHSQQKV